MGLIMEITKAPILKEVYTNNLYQSTFMPIFQKAEVRIKELVLAFFFFGRSKYLLKVAIAKIIADVAEKIPSDLHDKDQYLKGLEVKSNYFIKTYYDEPQISFNAVKEKILSTVPIGTKTPLLKNPQEVVKFINSKDLWAEAKGSPNVINYPKELNLKLNQLANETITTQEKGKQPISLWQKAELDVRYEHQMQSLQNMRVEGVKLAWISSHPNASRRCSAFQGELVALEGHAENPQKVVDNRTFNYNKQTYVIGRVDNHTVYSLPDIMATVDIKYGYHNNIICGFNCRHRLIPYTGQLPPREYTAEQLEKERKIESKIREMERNIRLQKTRARLYNEINEKSVSKTINNRVRKMVDNYKTYCEKNGYSWHEYRIKV